MTDLDVEMLEAMAKVLLDSGHYLPLRRFTPRRQYHDDEVAPRRTALFVDVETTGLDPDTDAIIEFCGVPFTYDVANGRVYDVGEPVTFLEDPGRSIPDEVVVLTGITDDMVRGQRIDDERVEAALAGASLVIAHNAAFDRKFLERRLPAFVEKPWACSISDVPWDRFRLGSTKLEYLVIKRCAEFFAGHRADEDCFAAIHLLATPLPCGTLPMRLLLESSRRPTVRIWALNAPYDAKDLLKARRYRWSAGEGGRPKAWFIDVPETRADEERGWLAQCVYTGRAPGWRCDTYDARVRYSTRV